MIKIGILGENYQNDACAFKSLMTPQYQDVISFVPLLKSLVGGVPPIKKVSRMLANEIFKHKLNAILLIRDLDNIKYMEERKQWFEKMAKEITTNTIFYLAIMEIEALILADIDTFNQIYRISGQYSGDPKLSIDPKKELKLRTDKSKNKYQESHAVKIFSALNFDMVYQNHKGENSFQTFINDFEEIFKVKRRK